jgi:hypothetical protein
VAAKHARRYNMRINEFDGRHGFEFDVEQRKSGCQRKPFKALST